MSTRILRLEPIDTWFFRDGRPYNQHEGNQTGVVSLFPPNPPTVLGALRAAFARTRGWQDGRSWHDTPELVNVLGDGPDELGTLHFRGPYVAHGNSLYWPLPAHVIGTLAGAHTQDRWLPTTLLAPAAEPVLCDMGSAQLPMPITRQGRARPTGKGGDQAWISTAGMNTVLRGELPEAGEIKLASQLWAIEPRVGIQRYEDTRTTLLENGLYSPLMMRMHQDTHLIAELDGIPPDWPAPPALIPLGGESRLASCHELVEDNMPDKPALANHAASRRIAIIHLSPAMFGDEIPGRPGDLVPDLPGARVISACVPALTRVGGWDGRSGRPCPLEPCIAAGSVWFCELDAGIDIDTWMAANNRPIGRRTAHGFGHIALGAWPEHSRK